MPARAARCEIRFRVDTTGTPVDPQVSESSGGAAVEVFALELATAMTFSAVTDGEAAADTWAEFPVSVGVRPRQ